MTALTIVTEAKRCDEGLRGSCSFSFGKEPVYVGGKDLTVAEVSGSFELRAAPASSGDAEVAQIVVEFGYSSSSEPSHRYASASVSTLPPPPAPHCSVALLHTPRGKASVLYRAWDIFSCTAVTWLYLNVFLIFLWSILFLSLTDQHLSTRRGNDEKASWLISREACTVSARS